ncbi:MAG: hypothetical protein J7M25_01945 [Deltaproteobacteria bacterium]|nr:hypothetical protein [Deltaproteobacteria bacterium]
MSRHPFLTQESRKRLVRAVESVEARSAAEVVIAVKPWSARYWYVDHILAAWTSYAALAFMMWSDTAFSLTAIVVGTITTYLTIWGVVFLLRSLRRWLIPARILDDETRKAARAQFVKMGVMRTRDRSGILVFVSLLEQRVWAVPDIGVTDSLGKEKWNILDQGIRRAIADHGVGPAGVEALAKAIEAMVSDMEVALPRRADDVNELADFAEAD